MKKYSDKLSSYDLYKNIKNIKENQHILYPHKDMYLSLNVFVTWFPINNSWQHIIIDDEAASNTINFVIKNIKCFKGAPDEI